MTMTTIRNENGVTLRTLGTELTSDSTLAVDRAGRLLVSVVPGSGATSLGKAEDSPAANGDIGVFALAVRGDGVNNVTSTLGDYSQISVNGAGNVYSVLVGDPNISASNRATQREDQPAGDGDTGFLALGVRADTFTSVVSANGDYTQLSTDSAGCLIGGAWGAIAAKDSTLGFASVTTSYTTIITNSTRSRSVCILNLLDKPVMVSFNATDGFGMCAAGGIAFFDLATNDVSSTANISVKALGSGATSGNIWATTFGAA